MEPIYYWQKASQYSPQKLASCSTRPLTTKNPIIISAVKPVVVGSSEWVEAGESGQVDVILEDHDVADLEVPVEAAGGVGHDQRLDATQLHHSHRHRALQRSIALARDPPIVFHSLILTGLRNWATS